MANARAEPVGAVRPDSARVPALQKQMEPAKLVCLNTMGFHIATGVSWLSGVTGVGLLYYGAASDLLFLTGAACLIFGAALFCTARGVLASSIARVLRGFGMGPRQASKRSEQLVSELCIDGMRGSDTEPPLSP